MLHPSTPDGIGRSSAPVLPEGLSGRMLQPAIEAAAGYPHGGVGASPLGEGGSDPLVANSENLCIPPCVTAGTFQPSTSIRSKCYGGKHRTFGFGYFITNSFGLGEKNKYKSICERMPQDGNENASGSGGARSTASGFWDNPLEGDLGPSVRVPQCPTASCHSQDFPGNSVKQNTSCSSALLVFLPKPLGWFSWPRQCQRKLRRGRGAGGGCSAMLHVSPLRAQQ